MLRLFGALPNHLRWMGLLFILLGWAAPAHAQISTKGREFWFSYMQMVTNGAIEYQVTLSGEVAAQATIQASGIGFTRTVSIVPGQTTLVNLPSPNIVPTGEGLRNTGVFITATADISVYATYQSNARTEATSVLPIEALGSSSEYIVATYTPNFNNVQARSQFVVVAVQDNTTVEIIPSQNTVGGRLANQPFQVTLARGQTFQVQGADRPTPLAALPDLTGSVVRSVPGAAGCRPFAVFAGITATGIAATGCVVGSYQHLFEQQYPLVTWGTQYALTPYTNIASLNNRGYPYRVLASQDNTLITLDNGNGNTVTRTLNRGQFFEGTTAATAGFDINRGVCIKASAPVAVAQYAYSQSCNGSAPQFGDPSLVMLTPVNQAVSRVTVSPARMYGGSTIVNAQNERHYVNVVMLTAQTGQFRILSQGNNPPSAPVFRPLAACSEYSYGIVPLPTGATIPSYTLETTGGAGFGAYVYGYNGPDAYAYTAAATFENQVVNYNVTANTLINNAVTGNFTICQGNEVSFTGFGTGVNSYTWDFGNGATASGQNVRHNFARPGTFTVTMRANTVSNCGFTEVKKELEILEVPRPNLGRDTTLCQGASLTLSPGPLFQVFGGTPSYEWSTGATTPTIVANLPGTYWVRVRNNGQCPVADTIVVRNLDFSFSLGADQRVCAGQRIPLGGAPLAGVTYTWSGLNNSPTTPLSATNIANPFFSFNLPGNQAQSFSYLVTARSVAGCEARDTINVQVFPGELPTVGRRTLRLCAGETRTIGVAPNAAFTYAWSPGTGLSSAAVANPILTGINLTADSVVTRYVLTISNQVCLARDTTDVVVYRLPQAAAGPDRRVCSNDTTRLGQAPLSGVTYAWSGLNNAPTGALSALNVANPVFRARNATNAPLIYHYVIAVRTVAGCTARDTVRVTVVPGELPLTGRRTVRLCAGEARNIGLTDRSPLLTYRWSPSANLSSDTIPNPVLRGVNSSADSLIVNYVLTISNGVCSVRDTTQAIIYRLPVADAGPDRAVCSGQRVVIGTNPLTGLIYAWSALPGSSLADLSASNVANPSFLLVNTTNAVLRRGYVLRVVNRAACFAVDTVQLSVAPALGNAALVRTVRACSGDTARLGDVALPGYRYSWAPATNLSASNVANPVFRLVLLDTLQRTLTYVRTTIFNECTLNDTVRVTVVPPLPKLRIVGSTRLCPGSPNIVYRIGQPRAGLVYRWDITGGTLVTGQGTPQIQVNWGPINPNARVVVGLENNPCNLGGDTLRVDVNLTLRPPKPFSPVDPDTLCVNQANNVRYALPTTTEGSLYQWFTSAGGRIVSGQNTGAVVVDWTGVGFPTNPPNPLSVRVWATETINTVTNRCFGASDTLVVLLYPSPVANRINGPVEVCENAPATYSLNGLPGSTYRWAVTGGQFQGAVTGNSISVLWGRSGSGNLTVTETSRLNCPGLPINLAVNINPLPRPQLQQADSVICRGDLSPKTYRVSGQPGSRFRWAVTGGRLAAFSPDSSQVGVVWDTLLFPKRLTVSEISPAGCSSTMPFTVPVYIDGTEIVLRAVTVQLADERNTELRFRILNAIALPQTFSVERRVRGQGNFQAVGTVLAADSVFTDRNLDTDANSYEYQIRRTQQTGPCATRTGAPHATIRLQGQVTPERVDLTWGAYQGWGRVARYEIWRRVDGETAFRSIGQVGGGSLLFTSPDGRAGFNQCYRIRAIEPGTGRESWSNEICFELNFPLVVPNVITPNNDGRNDRFVVPNLELYQQPLLQVFNRFGQLIYENESYRNDWDGGGYPTGTYFYRLRAVRPGQDSQLEYKGWVQVLR